MPQYEHIPRSYKLNLSGGDLHDTGVALRSTVADSTVAFNFEPICPGLFRTTFTSKTHPAPPHPSISARPNVDVTGIRALSGRSASSKRIELGGVTATVDWADTPIISLSWTGSEKVLHRDLSFRSYAIDGTGVAHYTEYKKGTLHVGLGEKAAPMDLSNRHFIMSATDCFGYDAYRTDPMYKHIPFLINATPDGCVGIFSTSHSRGTWCVGSEIDGLWGRYKVYRQDYGGLEEFLIVGKTLKDVVRTYADLVGYPKLVPRWAFGYIAGGMKYSMLDEPRACDALYEFAEKLKQLDIPCSAFQMSSGYTMAETEPKTRNVFTWNRHRFPDPQEFIKRYHAQGIRLLANVKPYVLTNHPEYRGLADAGALFVDPRTKQTAVTRLWSAGGGESGEGSHIDFTSAAGFKWWYDGVQTLKSQGVDAIWNDNNEYTISSDDWQCALESNKYLNIESLNGNNTVGLWGRSLQAELMGKASHDALVHLNPQVRPFVLTRSATAGTMRYAASSWSGDNVTSWESMRGANSIALNAGMSLLQCYGHDIGGFEGPQPSPELLLRWIQLGIYSQRFAINCFKTSPENNNVGEVIEPWMHPEVTPMIRDALKRRYELIPYLYSLALESHMSASPPQRWVGWGYESDPEVWKSPLLNGDTQYWLGDTLLVGGVFEPGATTAKMYLPKAGDAKADTGFLNLNAPYNYLESGQWVEIAAELKSSGNPVLARVGGAIPVGKNAPTFSPADYDKEFYNGVEDDYRAVEIFPPKGSSHDEHYTCSWYEDDGISINPQISTFSVTYSCTEEVVKVNFHKLSANVYRPRWEVLHVILPVGDRRKVTDYGFTQMVDVGKDNRGRRVFKEV